MSKRILLSSNDPGVGGVAQYNHALICELVKLDYKVTCLHPQEFSNQYITHQKQLGVQHLWLANDAVEELWKILSSSSTRPDLIICSNTNPFSNFAVKQVAIQLGIPYVIVEGLVEPHLAEQFPQYLDELSKHYAQAKSVVAKSKDNLNLLHKLFGLPKSKGRVIYSGRPLQYFTPRNSSVRENLRQEFDIPSNAVVCFTAARIETRKGYQYQLEAIKELMQSSVWQQLYFVWAGGGIFDPKLERQLRESIGELGIANKVKFLGQISDVSDWLNAADIFVFPSQLEGMPLCVMEAMAKGLPVIATAVSGIPEELGDTGKLLPDPKINPQATIKELVTTIQNWVKNLDLRHSIGQACKQRAEEMFKLERMLKDYTEEIKRGLNNQFSSKNILMQKGQEKQAQSQSEIKIVGQQRPWKTSLPRELLLSIQNGHHKYSYRGIPMIKNPFDFALYHLLIWNLKPRTIIEIGSKYGGSAVWLGDLLNTFDINGHIYSIDINKVNSVQHPRVTFLQGDGRNLQEVLKTDFLNSLPRPLLVIEDADHFYETSLFVLDFFHQYLREGEYILVEDGIISDLIFEHGANKFYNGGPHKAIKEFLFNHQTEYAIDSSYCDFFGYNLTWCTNGILKRISGLPTTDKKTEQVFSKSCKDKVVNYTLDSSNKSSSSIIIIDAVFFQLFQTGIARVWRSLLEEWAGSSFCNHIVVLDRAGTAPKIPGIRYRTIPAYNVSDLEGDRQLLQQICDEEGADLFISTYYTTPMSTPSVMMVYDMIPETLGWDIEHPNWRGKHHAIEYASSYLTISENTASDLVKFFPDISSESITVAHCGVKSSFTPASVEEINQFKTNYGISKPYFLLVGANGGYKNAFLFFRAFTQLFSRGGFEIVCVGSQSLLKEDFRTYTSGSPVHILQLSDEELKAAYSGAIALVYPSKLEGFGLPILEAIACGCPVITCPNASIPEVVGEAALYVNDEDVSGMANALCEVQKPDVRNSLIAVGLEQAKQFSWAKMAQTVSSVLIDAPLQALNLREINLIIFPNWSAPEESLGLELQEVVKAITLHSNQSDITLLVDTTDISAEDAHLFLSGVAMNLMMEEDIEVSDDLQISLIGQFSATQWQTLLPRLQARIVLEHENQGAIQQVQAESLTAYQPDSLGNLACSNTLSPA